MRATLLAVFLMTAILAEHAQAAGVIIGCFCVDGVRVTADGDPTVVQGGVWTPRKYAKIAGQRSRLFVFDRPVAPTERLETCDQVSTRAIADGAQLRLAGVLNWLTMRGSTFVPTGGGSTRFQIDENGLDAELGHVTSGAHQIGGGTMSLRGSLLWISNPTALFSTADRIEGTLQIKAWNRVLEDATLRLEGGAALTTTLRPVAPDRDNVIIRVDMGNGDARLWQGRFTAAPPARLSASAATLAALSFEDPTLTIGRLAAKADRGVLSFTLGAVDGRSDRITAVRTAVTTALEQATFQIARVEGKARQSTTAFELAETELHDASFTAPDMRLLQTGGDDVLIGGAAEARFRKLTSTEIDAGVRWTRPDLPAIAFLLPAGAPATAFATIRGLLDSPRVSGSIGTSKVSLARATLERLLDLAFDIVNGDGDLRVPVRFSFGGQGARFTIKDELQEAVITAAIRNADLDGTLVIPLNDLKESRLEVAPDRFHLVLDNTVATKPVIAGTTPAFGQLGLSVMNPTALRVGRASTGLLTLATDVFLLGEPVLKVGEGGRESRASLQLRADGSAIVRYDLADGKVGLRKARLSVANADFRLLDPTGTLDLSGTIIATPVVRLDALSVTIDEEQQPPVHQASARNLVVSAARVTRPRDPQHPKDVSFDAVPERPLTVARLEAGRATIDSAVILESIGIYSLDFALKDGSAHFGDGFEIDHASIALGATSIVSTKNGGQTTQVYDNASFRANGTLSPGQALHVNNQPSFSIDVNVSGPQDRLTGAGTARVDPFTGYAQSRTEIDFKCRDSDKLYVPIDYNFAIAGPTTLAVRVEDGKFGALGQTGPLGLALSVSGSRCNSPTQKHLIAEAQEGWTNGVCFRCCMPPEAYGCRWKWTTPEVSFNYNIKLEVTVPATTITMTNPVVRFEDQNLRVCNRGAITVLPGAIIAGYSPQIETPYPGADGIINTILSTGFVAAQSLALTAVANGAGFTATVGGSLYGNLQCLN